MRSFYTLLLLMIPFFAQAQELNVKEFYQDPTDISAAKYVVNDLNGSPCALIKLGLVIPEVEFEGDLIKSEYKDGEWWLYLIEDSNYLTVKTKKYLPLRYEFEPLTPKMTYIMLVEVPVMADAENLPTGTVNIDGSVRDVDVYVDGEKVSSIVPFKYNGTDGEHVLEMRAPGFNVERTVFTIELNREKDLYVKMKAEGSFNLNGISYEMVNVPAGSFYMGSDEKQRNSTFNYEQPVHSVTLRSYRIGVTEVTQALWEEIMGSNPSMNVGSTYPVENVTFDDVQLFIQRLNEKCGTDFRLPTEAEWEYAARNCGTESPEHFSGSSKSDKTAHKGARTAMVATKAPNELGLYDMCGNVAEWCSDFLAKYSQAKAVNPTGPEMGVRRIVRGGSYQDDEWHMRNAARGHQKPSEPSPKIGFRLAMDNF